MTNPLYSRNTLKLGLFGTNVRNGCAITTAAGAFETSLEQAGLRTSGAVAALR